MVKSFCEFLMNCLRCPGRNTKKNKYQKEGTNDEEIETDPLISENLNTAQLYKDIEDYKKIIQTQFQMIKNLETAVAADESMKEKDDKIFMLEKYVEGLRFELSSSQKKLDGLADYNILKEEYQKMHQDVEKIINERDYWAQNYTIVYNAYKQLESQHSMAIEQPSFEVKSSDDYEKN